MAHPSTIPTLKIDRDLSPLTSCDITTAWSLLKENLEKHIGKRNFACIPYITEGNLYDITSVFVKIDQTGGAGRRNRTYRPLGLIEDLLVQEQSWEVWHTISERVLEADSSDYPESFSITLEDVAHKTSITASFTDIKRKVVPKDFSPVGQVKLDPAFKPDLRHAKKIYFINEVISACNTTLHLKVNDGERVSIFKDPQPIAFRYAKFTLNSQKMIVQKTTVQKVSSLRTTWIRLNVKDDVRIGSTAQGALVSSTQEAVQLETSIESMPVSNTDTVSVADTERMEDNESSVPASQETEETNVDIQPEVFEMEPENVVSV